MARTLISTGPELKAELKAFIEKEVDAFDFTHKDSFEVKISKFIEEKVKDVVEPLVLLTPLALLKMQALVNNYDKEIAWHGTVQQLPDSMNFIIEDIFMYPQRVSAATVDADEDTYGQWLVDNIDKLNRMRMQGHSHVNMGVSPSGTDLTYYKTLLDQVEDYYIFLIMNKSGNIHIRFYDVLHNTLFTDIPIKIWINDAITDFKSWSTEEIKNKIVTPAPVVYNPPITTQKKEPPKQADFYQNGMNFSDEDEGYDKYGYPYNYVHRGR